MSDPRHKSEGPKQMAAPILPGTGHSPMAGEGLTRVIAIMCFLASLALGAFLAIGQATEDWTLNLTESVTVQLKPVSELSPSEQLEDALTLLRGSSLVLEATPLDSDRAASLLEPWLGNSDLLTTLPLPQLIEIKVTRTTESELQGLADELAAAIPGSRLDDHSRWNDRLVRFAGALKYLAFSVLALIMAATAMIVVFATRADMSSNHEIIEVLHLIGAQDSFIAAQFQKHFQWVALWASLMGIGAAAIAYLVIGQLAEVEFAAETSGLLPTLAFRPSFYAALMTIPILTVLTAALTARWTVMRVLKEVM